MFLSNKVEICSIVKYVKWIMNMNATIFYFCTYSREIIDEFSDLTELEDWLFWHRLFKGGLLNFV